jgi:hypothetical protein
VEHALKESLLALRRGHARPRSRELGNEACGLNLEKGVRLGQPCEKVAAEGPKGEAGRLASVQGIPGC